MYANKALIEGFMQTTYWTSTNGFEQSIGENASWFFSFYTGNGDNFYATNTKMRIRPVKSI